MLCTYRHHVLAGCLAIVSEGLLGPGIKASTTNRNIYYQPYAICRGTREYIHAHRQRGVDSPVITVATLTLNCHESLVSGIKTSSF